MDHVQPVTPPALAVARRGQQAIDQTLVGVGPGIGDEGLDLGRARRQAGEIVGHTTDQGPPIGGRDRTQARLQKRRQDQSIQGRADEAWIATI